MSDEKKEALKKAKLATAALTLLRGPSVSPVGLPAGVKVTTNMQSTARFPLPLTVGAAVMSAIGVLAMLKGRRIVGGVALLVGGAGLVAAAAAPELSAALKKIPGVA